MATDAFVDEATVDGEAATQAREAGLAILAKPVIPGALEGACLALLKPGAASRAA